MIAFEAWQAANKAKLFCTQYLSWLGHRSWATHGLLLTVRHFFTFSHLVKGTNRKLTLPIFEVGESNGTVRLVQWLFRQEEGAPTAQRGSLTPGSLRCVALPLLCHTAVLICAQTKELLALQFYLISKILSVSSSFN